MSKIKEDIKGRKKILLNKLIQGARHYKKHGNPVVFENFESHLKINVDKEFINEISKLEKDNLKELDKLKSISQSWIEMYFDKERGLKTLKKLKGGVANEIKKK